MRLKKKKMNPPSLLIQVAKILINILIDWISRNGHMVDRAIDKLCHEPTIFFLQEDNMVLISENLLE